MQKRRNYAAEKGQQRGEQKAILKKLINLSTK